MKYPVDALEEHSRESPSARKVWIEIFALDAAHTATASPSARKVWIEIAHSGRGRLQLMSPSARKVWIEIANVCTTFPTVFRHLPQGRCGLKCSISSHVNSRFTSPSARKVWIEILLDDSKRVCRAVTFRKEGVD